MIRDMTATSGYAGHHARVMATLMMEPTHARSTEITATIRPGLRRHETGPVSTCAGSYAPTLVRLQQRVRARCPSPPVPAPSGSCAVMAVHLLHSPQHRLPRQDPGL